MDVRDKVVIVTGASGGIGLATAQALAGAGAKLALAARSRDKLLQLSEELKGRGAEALVIQADMRKPEDISRMVEETFARFGRIDVLINNAGQSLAGTVEKASADDFLSIMELNLLGPFRAMQAVIPKMRKNGGGIIVNISSMTSRMHIPGLGTYACTKAALNLLSETARQELEADKIRVIAVLPRMTATDFGKNALGNRELRQDQRSWASRNVVVDPPTHVAERILHAIAAEPAEQLME